MSKCISLLLIAAGALAAAGTGSLSVQADRAGLVVYLDNDSIGTTPLVNHPVEPGEYWVSIFNPDSTQNHYYVLQSGGIGARLSTLWQLARVNKGTTRIAVQSGENREVFFSLQQIARAPAQAKWLTAGCVSVPFLLGGLLGALIAILARG
jgi:hypothetical protein